MAAPPLPGLLSLPDELFLLIARKLELLAMVRLRMTCLLTKEKTEPVYADMKARRMQWLPALTYKCSISVHGRKLILGSRPPEFSRRTCRDPAWAAGPLLPSRCSFDVRVDFCDNFGELLIGVCTTAAHDAWGLDLATGRLYRWGNLSIEDGVASSLTACPTGFPDGDSTPVMRKPDGTCPFASSLYGKADGATIKCILNDGNLSFRINGGPSLHALAGFPTTVQMRPWVKLRFDGDEVTLSPIADTSLA
mmetsp:Transcript_7629/g.24308  ORF Transcript_7629/g.24308 Transcript_7629/m.24308 type:complete len:250 (-) Transcript_7629:127-876(-)